MIVEHVENLEVINLSDEIDLELIFAIQQRNRDKGEKSVFLIRKRNSHYNDFRQK